MSFLQCLEREPAGAANAAVIWMHGLGATAHDFHDIPPMLNLPAELRVRYVFPQAPSIPVTINGGMSMPAWYDIRSLDSRNDDVEGIRRSEGQVRALVDREVERGVDPGRIVVAGFSQGGAMALQTALRHPQRLAGVMVLSAYLLLADRVDAEAAPANRDVPIFMAHGMHDPVVPYDKAALSRRRLEELDWKVEWKAYPMAHQVLQQEIGDIGAWLSRVLAA
ncbi:MAG: alpha/beta fold hydrolase [Acidobacteriota bacterium]